MLCKRCMTVMKSGTSYGQNKDGKSSAKRFYECKKCYDKVYTNESNFQECMNKATSKNRNK